MRVSVGAFGTVAMRTHTERSNEDIASGWIAFYLRCGRPTTAEGAQVHDEDPNWRAVHAVSDLRFADPARTLDIVFRIARTSSDDWVLENLGAGPLEDLIDSDPTLLDPIALEAPASPALRFALQCVWQRDMSEDTWARLQRIANSS